MSAYYLFMHSHMHTHTWQILNEFVRRYDIAKITINANQNKTCKHRTMNENVKATFDVCMYTIHKCIHILYMNVCVHSSTNYLQKEMSKIALAQTVYKQTETDKNNKRFPNLSTTHYCFFVVCESDFLFLTSTLQTIIALSPKRPTTTANANTRATKTNKLSA